LPKALGSNQTWCSDAQDMSEQHVESLFRDLDMNGTGAIEIEARNFGRNLEKFGGSFPIFWHI